MTNKTQVAFTEALERALKDHEGWPDPTEALKEARETVVLYDRHRYEDTGTSVVFQIEMALAFLALHAEHEKLCRALKKAENGDAANVLGNYRAIRRQALLKEKSDDYR